MRKLFTLEFELFTVGFSHGVYGMNCERCSGPLSFTEIMFHLLIIA
jgi:hypothetical protein